MCCCHGAFIAGYFAERDIATSRLHAPIRTFPLKGEGASVIVRSFRRRVSDALKRLVPSSFPLQGEGADGGLQPERLPVQSR